MSDTPTGRKPAGPAAANDNPNQNNGLHIEVRIPDNLVIQRIEVEVIAELLDSLPPAANDNEDTPE